MCLCEAFIIFNMLDALSHESYMQEGVSIGLLKTFHACHNEGIIGKKLKLLCSSHGIPAIDMFLMSCLQGLGQVVEL
jgi:hypothetical protein